MKRHRSDNGLWLRATHALWRRARSGNGRWVAAAIVASGLRLLLRMSRREREVVYSGELAPGQQLNIRHTTDDRTELKSPADQA